MLESRGDKLSLGENEQKLSNLARYPPENETNNAFEDLPGQIHVCRLHKIIDADKLIIGQAVWSKCRAMAYPNYDELFIQQQIEVIGLKLDKIENY